jgi:hypothetical protein
MGASARYTRPLLKGTKLSINVLYIPSSLTSPVLRQINEETGLSKMVEGWLEGHTLTISPRLMMMVNEEGKSRGLEYNTVAGFVANLYRPGFLESDSIVGNAVIVSVSDEGDSVDISDDAVTHIRTSLREFGLPCDF